MSDIDFSSLVPDSKETTEYFVQAKESVKQVDPWIFNGKPVDSVPEGHETFVYLITNKINGKRYVGFKTTVSKRTKIIKKKKRHVKIESNWRDYWSSSEGVAGELVKYGKENFIREILAWTVNKGVGRLIETTEQLKRKVLTENKDQYLNGIVDFRLGSNAVQKYNQVIYCDPDKIIGDEIAERLLKS